MKNLRSRAAITVLLVATVGATAPAVALASPAPSTVSARQPSASSSAWTTWRSTWISYIRNLEFINATYRASLASARATYRSALASATSKAQRQAAQEVLSIAISNALTSRVSAIDAAGLPPTPPAGYAGSNYVTQLQAANVAYRAAITSAESTLASALASATTTAQRLAARASYQSAVSSATTTRANALVALGLPPTHPGQTA